MRESEAADARWQAFVLRLAARGLGRVWPDPANACAVVDGDRLASLAWEPVRTGTTLVDTALADCRRAAAPTLHLAWEPPPAAAAIDAEAMKAAGVRRCVVAGPLAGAGGWAGLVSAAGIAIAGCSAPAASRLNAGYLARTRAGRPRIVLKLASSLDGRIATAGGQSRWITGDAARRRTHLLRARSDAILVGSGTAIADDPELTCRLPGLAHGSPVRVVLDRRLRLPADGRLARTAGETQTWVLTRQGHDEAAAASLARQGVAVLAVPDPAAAEDAMAVLAARGVTRLLVEGGAAVAAALLRADLVDEIVWFAAPLALGGDGLAAIGALGLSAPGEALAFRSEDSQEVGADRMVRLVRHRSDAQLT